MGSKGNNVIKHSINFDRWVHDAITDLAKKHGITFTSALQELLRVVLESEGYSSGIGKNLKKTSEAKPKKAAS